MLGSAELFSVNELQNDFIDDREHHVDMILVVELFCQVQHDRDSFVEDRAVVHLLDLVVLYEFFETDHRVVLSNRIRRFKKTDNHCHDGRLLFESQRTIPFRNQGRKPP